MPGGVWFRSIMVIFVFVSILFILSSAEIVHFIISILLCTHTRSSCLIAVVYSSLSEFSDHGCSRGILNSSFLLYDVLIYSVYLGTQYCVCDILESMSHIKCYKDEVVCLFVSVFGSNTMRSKA